MNKLFLNKRINRLFICNFILQIKTNRYKVIEIFRNSEEVSEESNDIIKE